MPVPTEFTDEELAEFQQHGVTMPAPGKEPTGESNEPPGTATPTPTPAPTPTPSPTPTSTPTPEPSPNGEQPRGPDGKFASKPKEGDQTATPTPSPTPTPTPAPADQQQQQTQQPPPGFVPHAALHAERERARSLAAQMATLTARTNALLMARQQPQEGDQPKPMPKLEEDPVGYITALTERLNAFEQARQEETQFRQIDTGLEQDEAMFAIATPDYEQASDYYVQSRAKELLRFHSPQDAQRILTQEARAIAQQSWQRGQSAAETIYALAQARGYQTGTGTPTPSPTPTPTPAPTPTPTPSPTPTPAPSPATIISAVADGQAATRSLSAGGSTAQVQELNAEALLNMSDEEFERHLGLGGKGANTRFSAIAGQ